MRPAIIVIIFLIILLMAIVVGYAYKIQHGAVVFTYDMHADMYELISHIHTLLYINNTIEYSLSAGSALGQARNKSIIPWDDDLDIYVLSTDSSAVEKLLKNDDKLDYNSSNFGFQTNFKDKSKKGYLDIFILYNYERDKLNYKGHQHRYDEWIYISEWDLELVEFGTVKVRTMKNVKDYLDRAFGKGWEKNAIISSHNQKSTSELFIDTNWINLYINYFKGKKLYQ
jgi:hypothetical protein